MILPIFAATNIGSMRRFISITFFLCLLLSLQAQEVYTTKNIPKVHLQDKTRYVCNPAELGVEGKEYVVQDGDIMHFRFNV